MNDAQAEDVVEDVGVLVATPLVMLSRLPGIAQARELNARTEAR